MLNFDFLEKSLVVSSTHFAYDLKKNRFLMLYSIKVSFSDCFYFLTYKAICALQLFVSPSCDVIDFEINLTFLIKPFFY